ncbi:MAG: T9SS type A sorting domain-containing protein [Balneolaceae bacterium]|nr:T9SS type A sorting domain-containing protein [Balneolaceae bacterium]
MKTSRFGVIWVILSIFLSTGIEAQQRIDKETRGIQKVLEKINSQPLGTLSKLKGNIDRGISSFTIEFYSGTEWMVLERHDLSYNNDRTEITEEAFFNNGDSFIKNSTTTINLNENGLLNSYKTVSVDGEYSFEQSFYYNDDFTFLDSVVVMEFDTDEIYYDKITFEAHTSDSIEIINYFNYGGEEGMVDGDYALIKDGNYIEHYVYDTFLDRYTYYDVTVVELLQMAFSDFQFYEVYNDEYYFDTEEWIPYDRITLEKDGENVVEILTEGWYDTEWRDEERYSFEYDNGQITMRTYEYVSGNSFTPESRRVYTYENATSSELPGEQPTSVQLSQNYPNPFNPSTNISFELQKSGLTRLAVYDMLGREVAEVINELKPAGSHQVSFLAEGLSSGLYYYVLEQPELGIRMTRSMTLIK